MAREEDNAAKVVLSTHRVSYVHLKEPSSFKNSDKKDYSIEFLIPYDHPDVERIERAIQHVFNENSNGILKGAKIDSAKFHYPLVDGEDILDENPKREEVIGMMVIKGKSSKQPAIFDTDGSELYELDDIYGGCYCRGVIVFKAFNHESGKKGISCYINSVKYMKDGEPFGYTATHEDYEDEPEEKPRGRGRAAEPAAPARGRRAAEPEEEAPRSRRGRAADPEPEEAPRSRRRSSEPAEEAPRGRGRRDDDYEDEAPRGRGRRRDDDLAD
jgi:hypothetical protein